MDFLSMGAKLFGGQDGEEENGGGMDLSNPFSMIFQMDKNGDGKISEEDFVSVIGQFGLGSIGDEAARQAFKQVDSNENGALDMSEAMRAYEIVKELIAKFQGG